MTLNDKVKVGDATTSTSTSTTTSQWQTYNPYKAEKGWECPRCGRINAPWVRQCDCSRSYEKWDITWNKDDYTKPWWYDYKVTCNGTPIQTQTESTVYQVDGSNCKDSVTGTWVNVPKTYTNSVKG